MIFFHDDIASMRRAFDSITPSNAQMKRFEDAIRPARLGASMHLAPFVRSGLTLAASLAILALIVLAAPDRTVQSAETIELAQAPAIEGAGDAVALARTLLNFELPQQIDLKLGMSTDSLREQWESFCAAVESEGRIDLPMADLSLIGL